MSTNEGIASVDYGPIEVQGARYVVGVAGAGSAPPLLLLHGFPETHFCWHAVLPALAAECTVVVTDLRGYGATMAPPGGPLGEGYSKREMATDLVAVMERLGFDRFAVAGHDRGGRVAYRMALDHGERVDRLAVLNIVPTFDQFERMAADAALAYWPWFFLAQPSPFAERLVAAEPEFFLRHVLTSWSERLDAITDAAFAHYLKAFTPETIAAICSDYRAAFHLDRAHDAADREAGRRIECPVLVHWGAGEDTGSDEPLAIWRDWAHDAAGGPLPCGHFIPEEAPDELAESLLGFLR